ncbi:hypothetical protein BDA99DRAFT_558937 [Phascolomyces articulosus]|uniref:Uncharacterized protein n=1 Tax=Phascolomyces articulosus TaxID=60185 RepID=A0AAD5K378_9FUNG|nr:hypothetical protein BDA99DRAFT_558937 [Phascolomyces articulosus]
MADDNTDFSMDRVPVEVALAALQKQVKELQRVAASVASESSSSSITTTTTENSDPEQVQALEKRIQELETANAKKDYRIEFLLRALDARDNNK